MLKGANISFIGFLVLLACAYSWDRFECDLRTGEGCTEDSEHEVFTVISKGYRNDSRDVNKQCKHFLKLKVKLPYIDLNEPYTGGTHLTSLSCRLELEGRSYYTGPIITVSEDPDITAATRNSPYFKGEGGNYRFSSRKNKNEFEQIISGYGWESMNVFFENGRFQLRGEQETTLWSPAVFTPEHPDKELYIGINMQYAQVKTERMGLATYSDKIGGGACKIECDTWDMNAS